MTTPPAAADDGHLEPEERLDQAADQLDEASPGADPVPAWRQHALALVGAVTALVMLAGSAALARNEPTAPAEGPAFELVNGLPGRLEPFFGALMLLGWFWTGVPVMALVAVWALRSRRAALVMVLSAFFAWLLADVLKEVFERPRPAVGVVDFARRWTTEGYGYPSGHTSVAAALFVTLVVLLVAAPPPIEASTDATLASSEPQARSRAERVVARASTTPRLAVALAILGAIAVGCGRIYIGVHYPLDVVGGLAIGTIVGIVAGVAGATFVHPSRSI